MVETLTQTHDPNTDIDLAGTGYHKPMPEVNLDDAGKGAVETPKDPFEDMSMDEILDGAGTGAPGQKETAVPSGEVQAAPETTEQLGHAAVTGFDANAPLPTSGIELPIDQPPATPQVPKPIVPELDPGTVSAEAATTHQF